MMKKNKIWMMVGLLAVAVGGVHDAAVAQSAYQQKVWRYVPAPGQFIDAAMLADPEADSVALSAIDETAVCAFLTDKMAGKANGRLLSLGGFGGYVVLGFDHRIPNGEGLDLRLYGNAYYAPGHGAESERPGGSAEPGVVYVSRDENGNGLPDDPWYEIAGSETDHPQTVADYRIVYHRPVPLDADVFWRDNQGDSGYVYRNTFHTQDSYYPWWMPGDSLVFSGRRLPDNAVNEGTDGRESWFLRAFDFGYADNHPNGSDGALIDLDWAVDAEGRAVALDSIDFVKIMTGVRQNTGWTGEVSTEVAGVEDLHVRTAGPTASERLTAAAVWRVYPNPCTTVFTMEGPAAQGRLYDMHGRCVGRRLMGTATDDGAAAEHAAGFRLEWPVSDLKPGLYLLEVKPLSGGGASASPREAAPVYYRLIKQ